MTNGISEIAVHGASAPSAAPAARSEREFARARSHSRVVRLLKFGLPLTALVMVMMGVGAAWFARNLPDGISVASTSIEGGRLVMQDPRMSGSDSDDRPYSMVARRAIQSLTGSGVDLEGVRAEIAIDDQTDATINAASGHYDPKTERLILSDEIAVDTTSGISIRLSRAEIDLDAGRMSGQGPVSITTPNQRLESGSVTIDDGGSKLSFGDRVKLTLLPNAADGKMTSD